MQDLNRFILKYCERLGLMPEVIGTYEGSITLELPGGLSRQLSWLSGQHIVQRVPPTESKGRRHTSVISIAVTEIREVNLEIPQKDISISTMRGSGHGGQAVNKTESTVRVVHIPSGINVRIVGPDQHGNKEKALYILRSRVADKLTSENNALRDFQRRNQVGLNDRGGKSFTWSYIEGWVKNHTSGKMVHNIKELERGNLDLLC